MNSLKIKKGDTVVVTVGKKGKDGFKGKQGKVIAVFPDKNRVIVDGLNMQKHHTKARSAQSQGGIVEQAGPIDASNVMVICPKCGKPTRVGAKIEDSGKKIRVCKRKENGVACGGVLDKAAKIDKRAAKADKKSEDKKDAIKADKKTADKKVPVKSADKTDKKTEEKSADKPVKKAAEKAQEKTAEKPAKKTVSKAEAADKTAAKPAASKAAAKPAAEGAAKKAPAKKAAASKPDADSSAEKADA